MKNYLLMYRHVCHIQVGRRLGPLTGEQEDEFRDAFEANMIDILMSAGPRRFGLASEFNGDDIKMVIVEKHGPRHLLMRLFWSPLELMRGHHPWQLRLDRAFNLPALTDLAFRKTLQSLSPPAAGIDK